MSSHFEDEEFEFDDDLVRKEHPEDRIADAGEDNQGIEIHENENTVSHFSDDIVVLESYHETEIGNQRKRKLKSNKVSFQE